MHALRKLMQGDAKHPKAPLGNNFRPPQPLYHRPVRTNIDFNVKHPGVVSFLCRCFTISARGDENKTMSKFSYENNTMQVLKAFSTMHCQRKTQSPRNIYNVERKIGGTMIPVAKSFHSIDLT